MTLPDLVNGAFEFAGACFNLINIRALLRDKRVQGVHWAPTLFFTSWGAWNIYYYPSLDQWASFTGGLFIVATNLTWISLVFAYRRATSAPDDAHRARVLEVCAERNYLITGDDGFHLYWPDNQQGGWSCEDLRIIADEMERRDKPWADEIDAYFKALEKEDRKWRCKRCGLRGLGKCGMPEHTVDVPFEHGIEALHPACPMERL